MEQQQQQQHQFISPLSFILFYLISFPSSRLDPATLEAHFMTTSVQH